MRQAAPDRERAWRDAALRGGIQSGTLASSSVLAISILFPSLPVTGGPLLDRLGGISASRSTRHRRSARSDRQGPTGGPRRLGLRDELTRPERSAAEQRPRPELDSMSMALGAIAMDYDGTLTETGALSSEVARALLEARASGLCLVLATGRRLDDVRRVIPEADALFDALVVENGALIARPPGASPLALAPPVSGALEAALRAQAIPTSRGAVLLATYARYRAEVEAAVDALGLDARLSQNRDALMVLPASVSKATGVAHALGLLGLDLSQCAALGDAQNDRELLLRSGLGVAVADAVDELKAVADRVLERPDGEGAAALLRELASAARSGDDPP